MAYNHIFKADHVEVVSHVDQPEVLSVGKRTRTRKATSTSEEDIDNKKFSKEIATLNYGLVLREREIAKRAEARGADVYEDAEKRGQLVQTISKLAEVYDMVDNEIKQTLKKTSWKRLSKTYRLKFVRDYVNGLKNIDKAKKKMTLAEIKRIGVENLEAVEYNMNDMCILKLNLEIEGIGKL